MQKNPTFMVVDDDDIDAQSIERALKKDVRMTNPIVRAKDGIEALQILRGEHPEKKIVSPFVILVDINMPRMDGIEFMKELRADPDLKSSTAFILSTSKRDEDQMSAYNFNIAGYIEKQNAGVNFLNLITLLGYYISIVELPRIETSGN
jgi:CheY-like chemotaxis protein